MSDAPLANDSERLARWVAEHAHAVRGFLLGLVRHTALADDLLQETFRRAWEARHRYQETGRERSYLLRIADRLATDHARRRTETTLNEAAWQQAEPASSTEDPAQQLAQQELNQQLQAALNALNEMQRRVLLLRYFGDLEFAEIADQLECPLGTVLSHCHRGLSNLRKQMIDPNP